MRTEATVGQTRWTPDGTQAPTPPRLFADPLAGLVTGSKADLDVSGDSYDEPVVPVAKPIEVDDDARARLAAMMEDDDEPPPGGRPLPLPPPSEVSAGGVVPGMVAEPDRRPARLRVRQALGGYPKAAEPSVADGRKSSSNANLGAIVLGLVLLAVFGFIALQVIISIVESIGSMVE